MAKNYWLSFSELDAADGAYSLWYCNNQGGSGTRLTTPSRRPIKYSSRIPNRIFWGTGEPSTVLLLGLGFAGIGYRRHRSKMAA